MYRCFYSSSFSEEYWQLSSELPPPSLFFPSLLGCAPRLLCYLFVFFFFNLLFLFFVLFFFFFFLVLTVFSLSVNHFFKIYFTIDSPLQVYKPLSFIYLQYFLSLLGVSAIRNAVDIYNISILFYSSFTVQLNSLFPGRISIRVARVCLTSSCTSSYPIAPRVGDLG